MFISNFQFSLFVFFPFHQTKYKQIMSTTVIIEIPVEAEQQEEQQPNVKKHKATRKGKTITKE